MFVSRRSAVPLRGLAALAAAALIPVVAGCEAGSNAPTQNWHQPTAGAFAVVHRQSYTIRVNNMFVLGPTPGFSLRRGQSAGLFLALYNEGAPDRLVGISAPGVAGAVRLPSGGISLGHQQSVLLTGPEPQIVLENLARNLSGGQSVRLVLTFQNAGSTPPLGVPVMPRAQYYATYSPAPPSPSPSPSPAGTRKHRKHGGPAATPTASPSP